MRIFISQPMDGLTEEEILNQRNEAIKIIKNNMEYMGQDIEIIESYFEDYNPSNGCVPLKYLSKSLELLADADIALFIGDWENARGCKIEQACAKAYGIKSIYWVDRG